MIRLCSVLVAIMSLTCCFAKTDAKARVGLLSAYEDSMKDICIHIPTRGVYSSAISCNFGDVPTYIAPLRNVVYNSCIGDKLAKDELNFHIDLSILGEVAMFLPYRVLCVANRNLADSTLHSDVTCRINSAVATYNITLHSNVVSKHFANSDIMGALRTFISGPLDFIHREEEMDKEYEKSILHWHGECIDYGYYTHEYDDANDISSFCSNMFKHIKSDYDYRKDVLYKDILSWFSSFDMAIDRIDIKVISNHLGDALFAINQDKFLLQDSTTEILSRLANALPKAVAQSEYSADIYGNIYATIDNINNDKYLNAELKEQLSKALKSLIPLLQKGSGKKSVEFILTPKSHINLYTYLSKITQVYGRDGENFPIRPIMDIINAYDLKVLR